MQRTVELTGLNGYWNALKDQTETGKKTQTLELQKLWFVCVIILDKGTPKYLHKNPNQTTNYSVNG